MSSFFTVVIPSYNRADFIQATIQSFLVQEFSDFELLVVDDGSTDNTQQVVEAIRDPRIRYFKKQNGERGAARNYGADRATGRFVTFFDSDDLVYPWYLGHAFLQLEKLNYPECYAQAFEFRNNVPTAPPVVDRNNNTLDTVNAKIRNENILACNGVFVRRDVLEQFRFSENRDLSGSEDWYLWLQLSAVYPFHFSPVVGSCLINHDQRGELNIDPVKLDKRLNLLVGFITDDKYLKAMPKKEYTTIVSTAYRFAALKRSDFGKMKWKSIGNLFKAIGLKLAVITYRTTFVTIKKLLFSWH